MNTIIQNLFFAACPGCQKEFTPDSLKPFCPECSAKLHFFDHRIQCPGCGGENHSSLEFCHQCLCEPPRPWQYAISIFPYHSFGRELIRKFKFNNSPFLARPFAAIISDLISQYPISPAPDIIVPIPLHPFRYLTRGYNQAGLIASITAKHLSIPMINALQRHFSMRRQSALNRSQRHDGLKNAFRIRKSDAVKNKNILIIDDVLTTGATLSAAANTLIRHGASSISVATIARSVSFSPSALPTLLNKQL